MLATLSRHRFLRRIAESLLTLFGVAVFVFMMLRAVPGDQITAGFGTEMSALNEAQQHALRAYYGLDRPLFVQFFSWLGNLFKGNLGFSSRAQESVASMTLRALPVTFELAVLAIVLALAIGIPLGLLSASKPNSARDAVGQVVGLAGLSVPGFLLATFLLTYSASWFGFNPNGQGYATLVSDPWRNLQQMLMPSFVLAFGIAAPIMRTTRTALLEVRGHDFVRTAKAKGVPPRRVQIRHVLGNALVPITTMTGLQFGYLLGGAVVAEQVFSIPGIGRQVLIGIQQKEYAVVQSTVLVIAVCFVVVNLLTDLLYRTIDPRVRAS